MTVPAGYHLGWDASVPPAARPAADVVGFYIGGDTPHIWTKAEVDGTKPRWRLPIWVRSDPTTPEQAALDAAEALRQLEALGATNTCLVVIDVETAADDPYVEAFAAGIRSGDHDHPLMVYGSAGNLFQTAAGHLTWVADPGATQPDKEATGGTQFSWQTDLDLDWFSDAAVAAMWDTKPGKPKPAPPGWQARALADLAAAAALITAAEA
jgi:hypothetical protein